MRGWRSAAQARLAQRGGQGEGPGRHQGLLHRLQLAPQWGGFYCGTQVMMAASLARERYSYCISG